MHSPRLIPTLSNGLTVAFPTLERVNYGLASAYAGDFTVTLGHTLTLSKRQVMESLPELTASEVFALANECATMEREERCREDADLRAWMAQR